MLPGSLKWLSEDASLHFVQWLTACAQQCFARWQVCPHTMRTFVAGPHGPMLIQFFVDSAPLGLQSWRLLTITSSSGVELFRDSAPANAKIGSRLASAIDMLFLAVSNTRPRRFVS
jgi:hypothetical protein